MIRSGFNVSVILVLVSCMTLASWGQEAKKVGASAAKGAAAKATDDAAKKLAKTPTKVSKESTYQVKRAPLKIKVNLTGVFEPTQMWPVVLRPDSWSSFTVIKAVAHGKRVKKGETLVWLDMTKIDEQLQDMEHALELGKLSRRQAEADWKLLQKSIPLDLKSAERSKRVADENLAYFMKVDRAFQRESVKFSLKSSRDSLEYTEEELKQLEKMYNADDLTEETEEIVLKRARNDVERSKFYLKSAELRAKKSLEQDLPREEQQLVVSAQRADILLAKTVVSLPVQIEKQKIEREKQRLADQRAQEKLAKLRQDREIMAIVAPADGYVYYGKWTRGKWSGADSVASQLTEGGKLSPQSVFMTIVNPRPLQVRVDVPEKELYRVAKGVQGIVTPNGYPDLELAATVQNVSALPLGKGIFDGRVDVKLGGNAKAIVPGMGCKIALVAYNKKAAMTVPSSAVFEDDADGKRDVVYVKRGDDKPEKRKIVIGQKAEKKWEVLRGLQENDEILLKKPDA